MTDLLECNSRLNYSCVVMIGKSSKIVLFLGLSLLLIACQRVVDVDKCLNLDEKQCLSVDECRGEYGPSRCFEDGICTEDLAFKGCKPIPSELLEKAKKNQKLCEETGGTWSSDFYTKPGRCECKRALFKDDKGCEPVVKDMFLTKYCKEFEHTGSWFCDDLDKYPGGVESFREKCESIGYTYEYNAKAYFADKMGVCAKGAESDIDSLWAS